MVTGVNSVTNMNANVIGAGAHAHKDVTAAKSDRRSNKPIMEKRRRARINNCLNELKSLILDATKKDPARHSKLEKADILEKTVKHLQELQRQQAAMQQAADPKVINKFKAGFADCANEVSRFPGLEAGVKRRLLQHLSNCINGVKTELHQQQRQLASAQAQQIHAQMLPSPPSSPEQDQTMTTQQQPHHHHHRHPHHHQLQQQSQSAPLQQQQHALNAYAAAAAAQLQHNMNGYFLPNGVQVIPTKLANGNVALVLPQALAQQQQLQQQQQQQQTVLATSTATFPTVPIPTRTASTSSASSHSSCSYEHSSLCSPASSALAYAPPSPANSYEAMDCKPSVIQHSAAAVQPLSLVIRKNIKEEEPMWRPW